MTSNERVNHEKQTIARWGTVGALATASLVAGTTGLNLIARGIVNMARKINS